MTLSDFRFRIAKRFNLDSTDGQVRDLIDDWINEGVLDFLRRTKMHVRLASLALTADQYSYELDTGILSMKDVWIDPTSGTSRLLEPKTAADILTMRTLVAAVAYPTMYYAVEGANMILLHPTPQTGDTLHVLYVPRPTAMTALTATPSATANGGIPEEYHRVIEAYVKAKAADYADDQSSRNGQLYAQEYTDGVVDAKMSTVRKAGVLMPSIIPGRRGSSGFPATPGIDLGF